MTQQPYPPTGQYPPPGQQWPPQPIAPKKKCRWPWIVGGIVLLLIVIGSVNGKPAPSSTAKSPAAAAPAAVAAAPAAPVTVKKGEFATVTGGCTWTKQ